jgi:hypothetical protein
VVSRYPSSDLVGLAKPLSAIEGQREGECLAQIVSVGGREGWLLGHARTVLHARERIKNFPGRGRPNICAPGLAKRYASWMSETSCVPFVSGLNSIATKTEPAATVVPIIIGIAKPMCQLVAK